MKKATKETVEILAQSNKPKYNLSKLAEELFELGEVIMKTINKSPDNQPPIEKIIEESGDVILRLKVITEQYNITDKVKERINNKAKELKSYYDRSLYVGGL